MYSQITANKQKTLLLMLAFVALIGLLGWMISKATGSPGLLTFFIIFAVVYALISYFAAAKIALALSRAKPVGKKEAPELYRIVENLAITAGLPMPQVYLIDDPAPNAFATGRDPKHAHVAATTGLIGMLEDEELEGVIAHELSHIGNYDIRLMGIVIMLVTIVAVVSDFFLRFTFFGDDDSDNRGNAIFMLIAVVMALLAPLIAALMQLAVSRKREYLADASGALLTRYPDGLASALAKIGAYNKPMKAASTATAHLYIANPFKKGGASGLARLFSTHPPIEDRVKRLQTMGREA